MRDEFLAAYDPAARKLMDFYANVRIRVTYTDHDHITGSKETYERVFMANGLLIRLDEFRPDGTTVVRVVNPGRIAFNVGKRSDHDKFMLLGLPTDHLAIRHVIHNLALVPVCSYAINGIPIAEYVRFDDFEFKTLTSSVVDGVALRKLSFQRVKETPTGKKEVYLFGWFVFAPEDCWALREALIGYDERPNAHRWQIEYRGKRDGVPLIHKLELWGDNEEGKRVRTETMEVTELVMGPVPEEEFALAAFGISDAGLRPHLPTWFYWQIGVVLCLVVLAVLWLVRKKMQTTTGTRPDLSG